MTKRRLHSAAASVFAGAAVASLAAVLILPFSLAVAQSIFLVSSTVGIVALVVGTVTE